MSTLLVDINLELAVQRNTATGNVVADGYAVADQGYDKQEGQFLSLVNGTVDQVISLGLVSTATLVMLISSQPITVKLNGAATGLLLTNLVLTGAAVTSMTISNASGSTANIRLQLFG